MSKSPGIFSRLFGALWQFLGFLRNMLANLILLFFLLLIAAAFIRSPAPEVPQGAALVIAPQGSLVEQESYINPLDSLSSPSISEVVLHDLLDAIDGAIEDSRISAIVLRLDELDGSGFSKLREIAVALERFRATGRKVYAVGDSYSQGQYYLASAADEILLHPLGGVELEGFGSYQLFFRSALDKLKVNFHVFRVGEFKSAVEPYERDEMSEEARADNLAWLEQLWELYRSEVNQRRGLDDGMISAYINTLDQLLATYQGDSAQLALEARLVDALHDRLATRDYLIQAIGPNRVGNDFLQVDHASYLRAIRGRRAPATPGAMDQVGVIIARGTIYDGIQRAGNIGGDSLASLIRQAREDDAIKALVLRIDTGGGSAFASEVIRQELLRTRASGKPVVVSMGSLAASGGYWVASAADEIWASPATLTGSIGIFALYPTFAETLDSLGIHADGVGTTALTGAFVPGRELPPLAVNAIQSTLENGYRRFLDVVAEGRAMDLDQVESLAQGRVWSGQSALERGLVDNLGDLDQAIDAAATLADLSMFEPRMISPPLSPAQQLLREFSRNLATLDMLPGTSAMPANNPLARVYQRLYQEFSQMLAYNDPRGLYLLCMQCGLTSP